MMVVEPTSDDERAPPPRRPRRRRRLVLALLVAVCCCYPGSYAAMRGSGYIVGTRKIYSIHTRLVIWELNYVRVPSNHGQRWMGSVFRPCITAENWLRNG